ncbi:MAG: hypothetical protein ACREON_03975, partial [Gemmatimonadaceae bacterium]
YQLSRRVYLGSRFDLLESTEEDGDELTALSGYLQFYPSEFSKLMVGLERVMPGGGDDLNRILLQATFSLGPHRPHPF